MVKSAADELVVIHKKDWNALIMFLRAEEKTLKDSYNTPGKNDWEVFYKENHMESWAVYDAARQAANRKPRKIGKR